MSKLLHGTGSWQKNTIGICKIFKKYSSLDFLLGGKGFARFNLQNGFYTKNIGLGVISKSLESKVLLKLWGYLCFNVSASFPTLQDPHCTWKALVFTQIMIFKYWGACGDFGQMFWEVDRQMFGTCSEDDRNGPGMCLNCFGMMCWRTAIKEKAIRKTCHSL